jgi:homoserine kinase
MGPGFDSFGFAVDLENDLIVERGPFVVNIVGEGEDSLPVRDGMSRQRSNMQGVGCGVWGAGCGVWGVWCGVLGVGCRR